MFLGGVPWDITEGIMLLALFWVQAGTVETPKGRTIDKSDHTTETKFVCLVLYTASLLLSFKTFGNVKIEWPGKADGRHLHHPPKGNALWRSVGRVLLKKMRV